MSDINTPNPAEPENSAEQKKPTGIIAFFANNSVAANLMMMFINIIV